MVGTFPKKNNGPPRRNDFNKNRNFKPKFAPKEETAPEPGNRFQRKANFNRNQEKEGFPENRNKPQGREFRRKEEGQEFDHNGQLKKPGSNPKPWERKRPKFDKKSQKNPAVKGTSTDYAQLANSDESDDGIPDVDDMLDGEIPLINTSSAKKTVAQKSQKSKAPKFVKPESEDEQEEADDGDIEMKQEEGGESEESEDEDEEERLKFREEMANMPIGKVREMKEKLGIKLFNKTYFGESEQSKLAKKEKKKEEDSSKGQHRPKEMSSKRPVSSFRNIYGDHEKSAKVKKWDPRFDERAGNYKEVCFENNYQFLDEIRKDEIEELRQQYNEARAEGDEHTANRVKNTLQKMETREKTRAEKRRQTETRKELHDENIERMLRGEAPIFKTKAAVRKIDMEKKFESLKKDNKLDKYLEKKSKKEAGKLKKSRPPFEGYGF
ncbi:unnamed protein product [Caenorhabditis angaria]|uniref:rRNA biogenesis protein RRP36 n=1 Tax=Caenorhabditis angaria TaxID=860376 RepID=A0A9P1IX58_9PELO|nr:unnamed protein product [Caenorhabditis angaria]